MTESVTKTIVLQSMMSERRAWDVLLDAIPKECMTVPAINSGWTIKDTVAHVTYYESWLLEWLEAAVRGQVTVATHRDLLGVDARNAIVFEENRMRPLDVVLEQSRRVFDRLLLLVRLLPEQDLRDPTRFERYIVPFWHDNRPLWKCIASDSYEHYREHRLSIRAWLDQSLAAQSSCHSSGLDRHLGAQRYLAAH